MVSGEPCYLLHNFIKPLSDYLQEEFIHLLVTKINKLMPKRVKIEFHIFIYMVLSYLFVYVFAYICMCIGKKQKVSAEEEMGA